MRYLSIVLLLLSLCQFSSASQQLSDKAHLSVLTCSPGDQLYSLFGHSAIRVKDPVAGFDLVFNYGTFDFDTPNFYLKFAKGDLNYWLTYYSFERFKRAYAYYGQSVTENKLNLSQTEKQQLFDALLKNAEEENRYYRYDFLFDNCATRIRDIIAANVEGELKYTAGSVEAFTYRQMLHQYDGKYPWISNGLDIILGMKTDDDARLFHQMFLPDYLQQHLLAAVIENGETRKLLEADQPIITLEQPEPSKGIGPGQFFWFLFFLSAVMVIVEVRRAKPLTAFNRIFLFLSGAVGALIFFLWFLSRHSVTGENFNILWAMPFNLFVAFFASWFFQTKLFKIYLIFLIICAAVPVVFGWLIPQYLPVMVYPLCLLLISRYASWLYLLAKR
ncbi:Lnb N-terminal periplasmic domain-containing protein [Carboxylicivirga taeanensis]|uniref:Lnb N-terminal periplasmic domain-containing protein n=1 Tax=Carboxylicivirga taeanensis TaxID=1416875 RepID=UPI003F6DBBB7